MRTLSSQIYTLDRASRGIWLHCIELLALAANTSIDQSDTAVEDDTVAM